MARKQWQKPHPLRFANTAEQPWDFYNENENLFISSDTSFSSPSNLVIISDNLKLAPFSKRAVVDFGESLTVGLPTTRYLRLRNPHSAPVTVHCKRYPTANDFSLSWVFTTKENVENLPDPETQALVDFSIPPINLANCESIHLEARGERLLRVVWIPKPNPLSSALHEDIHEFTSLRHVMQFRLNGAAVVEAIIVASRVKHPTVGGKKIWKKPRKVLDATRILFSPPLSPPNLNLKETTSQCEARTSTTHFPDTYEVESLEPELRPFLSSRASLVAEERGRMSSSVGLRAFAAFTANRNRRRSHSLDSMNADVSISAAEGFHTPRRSTSIANGLQRTPEDETTSFISPALLSPVVKRNTNILFTAEPGNVHATSTISFTSGGNTFGWDASAALSMANEMCFTTWLNHLFARGYATQPTLTNVTGGAFESGTRCSRTTLLRLVHSPSFSAPAHRIEREIDGQRLVINHDLNFRADKGLQLRICDLFTSHYAPIWLSPCVDILGELVQSPETPMTFPAKAASLCKRVYRYLFPEVYPLSRKPGANKKRGTGAEQEDDNASLAAGWKSLRSRQNQGAPSYTEQYNRQVVKRCLTLIWLLDHAKTKEVIQFNPCLFKISASVKSSAEVCHTFGRNYLSRETNLARSLAILGANLSVVQKPLDEFDFTVTNLAVDLRDGLRLVKLADLLLVNAPAVFATHNGNLISLVRFPAISRLQKIHNVRLALSAFKAVGGQCGLFTAAGKPITERDIVDGHRAKTLSLLWFILLRFQVTALLDPSALCSEIVNLNNNPSASASKTSPCHEVDGSLVSSLLALLATNGGAKGNDPFVEMECNQRALFLWAKAVCSSGGYEHVKIENLDQSFADGRAFCYLLHFYLPTLLPRRLVRDATTQTAHLYPSIPHTLLLRNNMANLRLFQQRLSQLGDVPMLLNVGGDILPTTTTTVSLSSSTAGVHEPRRSALLPPGAVLATLAFLASRLVCIDGGVSRLRRIVSDHAARIIQTRWRQNRAAQGSDLIHKLIPLLPTANTSPISSSVEEKKVESATAFGSKANVDSTTTENYTDIKVLEASVRIQRAVRTWLEARRRCRQKQSFVIEIQSQARAFLARREILARQQRMLQVERAAVVIQGMWRAKVARHRFLHTCATVVHLQALCRGFLARRAFQMARRAHSAAVIIQRCWRSHRQRRSFLLQRRSVCIIQRRWRTILARRARLRFAVQLQAIARAYFARRLVEAKINAVLVIQRYARSWLSLRRKRAAAVCIIQMWWRATMQRCAFLRTRHATVRIQQWWRSHLLERQRKVAAALIIQNAWRRFQTRRNGHYAAEGFGAVSGGSLVGHQKPFYTAQEEKAALVIQRMWRASGLKRWLWRRHRAAIVIQSVWRGHLVRSSATTATSTMDVRRRLGEATQEALTRPHNCLGARARSALANLLRYTSVPSVLDALGHLDTATRLSREVSLWLLTTPSTPSTKATDSPQYLPQILLRLLHLCNRSVANEEVALAAVAVLFNLATAANRAHIASSDVWWKQFPVGEEGPSRSVVEFLLASLQRLSRAKPGTLSLRLFARVAALLATLFEELPSEFVLPTNYLDQVEVLLSTVRRLWSSALAKIPVRPEVHSFRQRYQNEPRRILLRRLVGLELDLERLPSKPQVNPLSACELLLLTLQRHQQRSHQCCY